MLSPRKVNFSLLVFLSGFAVTANAVADAVEPLPFGDGSLVALGAACAVGIVCLARCKRK